MNIKKGTPQIWCTPNIIILKGSTSQQFPLLERKKGHNISPLSIPDLVNSETGTVPAAR